MKVGGWVGGCLGYTCISCRHLTHPLSPLSIPGTPYEVQDSIEMTMSQQALRIYGGHVFIAGGRLRFISCVFMDLYV